MISTRDKLDLFSFPFFTAGQCRTICHLLGKLQNNMVERKGFFHTYAGSAYLDMPIEYHAKAAHNFEILKPFYPYLAAVRQYFNAEPFPDNLSPPGFHIFGWESNEHRGLPHIDTPAQKLSLTSAYGAKDVFSFTIPLHIPTDGAGLDFWENLTSKEFHILREGGSVNSKIQRIGYELGHMYIHSGLCPHRIASIGIIQPGDFRITMQGHGIVTRDDKVILFF